VIFELLWWFVTGFPVKGLESPEGMPECLLLTHRCTNNDNRHHD